MTKWAKLFPDFEVPPVFEVALRDASEHNDACPKFELGFADFLIVVFIDHPVPKLRESGGKRFEVVVTYMDNLNEMGSLNLLKTDDLPEVISLLSMIKEANQ